eukprot:TRINITY_DN76353_c0_g1_i1.p1 TRINITY_DN76353_c0_g1~~TRINITY_DN76353_c0_g1_i1.p1  ORF type:complete len:400 (+),score=20.67 TRINITY_DN76353_c0_g1_i1:82-1281(+)
MTKEERRTYSKLRLFCRDITWDQCCCLFGSACLSPGIAVYCNNSMKRTELVICVVAIHLLVGLLPIAFRWWSCARMKWSHVLLPQWTLAMMSATLWSHFLLGIYFPVENKSGRTWLWILGSVSGLLYWASAFGNRDICKLLAIKHPHCTFPQMANHLVQCQTETPKPEIHGSAYHSDAEGNTTITATRSWAFHFTAFRCRGPVFNTTEFHTWKRPTLFGARFFTTSADSATDAQLQREKTAMYHQMKALDECADSSAALGWDCLNSTAWPQCVLEDGSKWRWLPGFLWAVTFLFTFFGMGFLVVGLAGVVFRSVVLRFVKEITVTQPTNIDDDWIRVIPIVDTCCLSQKQQTVVLQTPTRHQQLDVVVVPSDSATQVTAAQRTKEVVFELGSPPGAVGD